MIESGRFMRLMALGLVCLLASGQQPAATDWNRLRSVPLHASIIVKTKTGESYHGEFVGVTDELLSLDSDERAFPGRTKRRRDLRREEVLEVRRFSPVRSTLATTGIGVAVGSGIGAAIDSSSRSNEDGNLVTVVFAFLGALFGWAIGRHSTLVKGETIYTAP
jgi:hypothetical protein